MNVVCESCAKCSRRDVNAIKIAFGAIQSKMNAPPPSELCLSASFHLSLLHFIWLISWGWKQLNNILFAIKTKITKVQSRKHYAQCSCGSSIYTQTKPQTNKNQKNVSFLLNFNSRVNKSPLFCLLLNKPKKVVCIAMILFSLKLNQFALIKFTFYLPPYLNTTQFNHELDFAFVFCFS